MPTIREGKPFFIYALVCPLTLEVKYVGQTIDLEQRTRGKTHRSTKHGPLTEWLRTLGYLRPYRVVLQQGINRRVTVVATRAHAARGRRPQGVKDTWLSSCLEAKWIKRFRRTIINKNKTGEIGAYQALVNPSLPWGNESDAPSEISARLSLNGPVANSVPLARHPLLRSAATPSAKVLSFTSAQNYGGHDTGTPRRIGYEKSRLK